MDALGTLLKEPIQYYAKVNLGGFVTRRRHARRRQRQRRPRASATRTTASTATRTASRSRPGATTSTGNQALAYARVRKPAGESDFTRAARQQEVISGIRDAIVKGGFLNDPIGLIKSIGAHGPDERAAQGAARSGRGGQPASGATRRIGRSSTIRSSAGAYDARGSIQVPDIPDIRALAAKLFPPSGTLPTGPVPDGRDRRQGQRQRRERLRSGRDAATEGDAKPTPKPTAEARGDAEATTATPEPTPDATP